MSGQWPPGWEDPEDSEQEVAGLDAETDVRLSEVTAFLAAVPAPALPDGFESRILAAIAAESVARAAQPAAPASAAPAEDSTAPAAEALDPRILRPRPVARGRVRRPDRVRRSPRLNPALVAWPVAACLFFAGIGYLVSNGGSSASSSMPVAAAPASSAPAAASSGETQPYSSSGSGSTVRSAAGSLAGLPDFALVRSGTDYRAATLAVQVRAVIAGTVKKMGLPAPSPGHGTVSAPAASKSASSPASSAAASASQSFSLSAITPSLRGCVVHFTGGAAPRLIDRASYQGTPAYVIASDSRVWVVGLGCTAAHPDLIASAPLGG